MFYFTPLPGFFSPFPHGTCSLSAIQEYLALDNGLPSFVQGFSCPVLLRNSAARLYDFVYGTITLCGAASQPSSPIIAFCNSLTDFQLCPAAPTTPHTQRLKAYIYMV